MVDIPDLNQRMAAIAMRETDPKKALPMLKGLIKAQTTELDALKRRTVETAVDLGQLLAAARRLVSHGKWATWVEKNCAFTTRHANRLIQLSVYYHGLEARNRTLVSDLTLKAAIEMARQKADPAKFDAEDFPARVKKSPPEDVEDEAPWEEEKPSESVQPAPALPPPPQATNAKPAVPENNAYIRHLQTKDEIVEAEFREIETVANPSSPPSPDVNQPSESVQTPSDGIEANKPLATPKELLRDAYRIINKLNRGKRPDPEAVMAWVAMYDMLTISNKLAGDRDNDMEI